MRKNKFILRFMLCLVCMTGVSCVFYSTHVGELSWQDLQTAKDFTTNTPSKAHLIDGSVVIFPFGFELKEKALRGRKAKSFQKGDFLRKQWVGVTQVPLDSVAGLEYYQNKFQPLPFLASLPAVTVGSIYIYKAIFGSCPTIYSYDGEEYTLEAEAFSYSIAPRFENDDLDRLESGKTFDGEYRLKVANEALETHYLNSMALLAVDHAEGFEAFPSTDREIVLFGKESALLSATSKSGDEVAGLVSSRDSRWYQSDSLLVAQLTREVTQDWIDIKVNIPRGARRMAVALRLRNTLMNTVLLYDVMLQAQGIAAMDWLGSETSDLLYAWRLSNWYKKHFGLRIQLFDGRKFEDVARIGDSGPIAWHQTAVELPVPKSEVAQLRFAFLPDNWAIDWIGVSFDGNDDYRAKTVLCSEMVDRNGTSRNDLLALFEKKDDRYLITYPGDYYLLKFRAAPAPEGQRRTCFVKSRGFYIEWLRREWLTKNPGERQRFELNDQAIKQTAQLWLAKKQRFEQEFFASKIAHEGGN
ncbi:MAG: hypothetical protein ONB46_20025 [candidate division KSB1 bacterium]|nr:hypothetical protein [candidate division KSB1 bacterium]MDZ7369252.1 hypothetical protein [candidate division KSB1 bacterium]